MAEPENQDHGDDTTPPDPTPSSENSEGEGIGLRQKIGAFLGPLAMAAVLLIPAPEGMPPQAWLTVGLAFFMAIWWVSEVIPVAATALLPVALIPFLGLGSFREAAEPYASPVIFLFLGGFMIATAVQRWDLHRRVALHLIHFIGTGPRQVIAGFMVATAFLSMWISNTATAVMMLPIGLSLIGLIAKNLEDLEDPTNLNFAVALMLGIAYSSSIGGAATLIGTPPNALLAGFVDQEFDVELGFGQWMLIGVPFTVVMLPIAFFLLVRFIFPVRLEQIPGGKELIQEEIEKLGPLSRPEKTVAAVFFLTATAWLTRPFVEDFVPGLSDAGIAIIAALILFLLPVEPSKGRFALDWDSAREIPWRVLILFGGGLSLANMISEHGLAAWVGESLTIIADLPILVILIIVAFSLILITQITTNTAAASTFYPILAALAFSIGEHPYFLLVPAALGATCAFILPVATPPNAIMYGSSFVKMRQMVRAGMILNLLFALAIPLLMYGLLLTFFGLEPGTLPDWAP